MPCDPAQWSYGVSIRSAAESILSNPGVLLASIASLSLPNRIDEAVLLELVDDREVDQALGFEVELLAADTGVDHRLHAFERRPRHTLDPRRVLAPGRLDHLAVLKLGEFGDHLLAELLIHFVAAHASDERAHEADRDGALLREISARRDHRAGVLLHRQIDQLAHAGL